MNAGYLYDHITIGIGYVRTYHRNVYMLSYVQTVDVYTEIGVTG